MRARKGINLPEATYLLHFERPWTHANCVQRSNRIHRIDSLTESVFIYQTYVRLIRLRKVCISWGYDATIGLIGLWVMTISMRGNSSQQKIANSY